jgi:hypothetical protein
LRQNNKRKRKTLKQANERAKIRGNKIGEKLDLSAGGYSSVLCCESYVV